MSKLNQVCENWYNKTNNLLGKVVIVNTLMASLFVYKMSIMTDLTEWQLKIIEDKIKNYFWLGKRARIAMNMLTKSREQGGLRLVDICAKQKSLKIQWIFKAEQDEFLQVLASWCELNYSDAQNKNQVLEEIIWYNSALSWPGSTTLICSWFKENNILMIADLCINDRLLSIEEFCVCYPQLNWLDYRSFVDSFPPVWRMWLDDGDFGQSKKSLFDQLSKLPKVT